MSILKGTFTSLWDGNESITTYAELDTETGSLEINSVDVSDMDLEFLDEEYFKDEENNLYEVCPDCHEFIMREKCIEGEGNGNDYDGQKICSNPYCESNWVKE